MVSVGVVPWRSEGALTSSSSKLGPREGRLPLPRCSFGPPLLSAHSPGGGKEKSRNGTFRRAEDKAVDILPWLWMNTQQEHRPPHVLQPASWSTCLPQLSKCVPSSLRKDVQQERGCLPLCWCARPLQFWLCLSCCVLAPFSKSLG